MVKAAILGCGAWGTTLAKILAENGQEPTVWCHDAAIAAQINARENKELLPGIILPAAVKGSVSLAETLDGAGLVVVVTASQYYRQTVVQIKNLVPPNCLLLSATKGLDETTGKRMSEVLAEYFADVAVLSGPNISREIAEQKITATVIAAQNHATARTLQKIFNNNYFRVYTNNDVIGTEYGGALKNIIAIAAGIIDGQGLGNNAKAALLVRGMTEIAKLTVAHGGQPATVFGLTGMGDLITTCSSALSRNHHVGEQLAQGKKLSEILHSMKAVAEGVPTTKLAYALARQTGTPMPLTEQIHAVLYENKPVQDAITALMSRDLKAEGL
ncbi:glycerol-3-phosphate dehydrogenase [Candidatus Termititenax persephonae]|uniref:Glycerol-3-phosphate dehydrogenase [NAD(P)+] n=1 Tax=Candidatus Termititenax persephonae TaxID=2218525 RepID=A0A388TIK5_9BACT|nr:glycerol-3-phosphate dehydrogenase [Candidatus Termititenax persephonae]